MDHKTTPSPSENFNTAAPKAPEALSFEEAMRELESVVRSLETGQVPLEDAIQAYERGAALKSRCDQLLKQARLKVEEIMKTPEGDFETESSTLNEILKG